ncbi:MAG: Fe-S cluster assembly protein SufD [Parachlamydia sp.]|nr:Fe-S cluster assembly protein SufD [Parachlamydia sp.]
MMAEPRSEQDTFQEMLARLYEEAEKEPALLKIRAKAWDHFLELGLPSRKSEAYRYTRLRNLYSRSLMPVKGQEIAREAFETAIYPECRGSLVVFVNGVFRPHLSQLENLPKKVVLSLLTEATRTFGAFIQNQWARSLKEETDPFAALNAALHSGGAFLYVPPKTIVESPVQILNVTSADEPALLHPRLHCFVGSQSQIDLYNTHCSLSGSGHVLNQVIDLTIEEEAHVRCVQMALVEQEDIWHLEALRAHLKRNSTLKTFSVTLGSSTVRQDYHVMLTGENCEADLKGIWMLSQKREAHTHVIMDHQAPFCRSSQLYKGVLNDFSHSSFEGKILVRQAAQKTVAFQANHNLLLSDRAMADSKPNLEIFADDVKASHGATFGQLDKEQLFYMKSRGFSSEAAKNLLVYGFCKEVIDAIPFPSLVKDSEKYLKRLNESR